MEMQIINLLNIKNALKPRYNPFDPQRMYRFATYGSDNREIRAYYTDNKKVIIVGVAGPKYIYWLSVTKMNDTETNEKIIDYLNDLKPAVFGQMSAALEKTEYTCDQLDYFYSARVYRGKDILSCYNQAKEMCRLREAKGEYIDTLRYYLEILQVRSNDPVADYEKNEELIELVRSENYLLCSDNTTVSKLYKQLVRCCSELFDAYQISV